MGLKKMMVAIDEGEFSAYTLNWVLENLKPTINCPLVIIHAQPIADFGYAYAASIGTAPTELIQSIQEHQQKLSEALLERAKEICASHQVDVESVMEIGDPREVICEAVEKHEIDLLVLGSRGLGALQRAFMGSVSSYCVHHAKCPVLVVKKPL